MNKLLLLIIVLPTMLFWSCRENENGCTDPKADNYNFNAVKDDGSCLYGGRTIEEIIESGGFVNVGGTGGGDTIYVGCTDVDAFNYDPKANVEGPCYYIGCTDSTAENYDPKATINSGDCIYAGCTDPEAENYDPKATIDDGSCIDIRQKFVGNWTVTTDCGFQQIPVSANQDISIESSNKTDIIFSPFAAGGDATGKVSNRTQINIALTSQGPFDYSASGSINAAQNEISLNVNYVNNIPFVGGSGTCSATYVKN